MYEKNIFLMQVDPTSYVGQVSEMSPHSMHRMNQLTDILQTKHETNLHVLSPLLVIAYSTNWWIF